MRLNYYRFPEEVSDCIKAVEGCEVTLLNGNHVYTDTEEKYMALKNDIAYVDCVIYGLSVTATKRLIKKYGGCGWTNHCDRDGSVFETTEIKLAHNNSRFKYNVHL